MMSEQKRNYSSQEMYDLLINLKKEKNYSPEENYSPEKIAEYKGMLVSGDYYFSNDYNDWLKTEGLTQLDIVLLHPKAKIPTLEKYIEKFKSAKIYNKEDFDKWAKINNLEKIEIKNEKVVIPEDNYKLSIKKQSIIDIINQPTKGGKKSRKAKKSLHKRKTNKNKKTNRRRRR